MYLPNITAWTLITVLNGGNVSHSEGFQSFSACQNARQLILTGRTVEKEKEYLEEFAKAQEAKEAARKEYAKSHPNSSNGLISGINTTSGFLSIESTGYVTYIRVAECVPEVEGNH